MTYLYGHQSEEIRVMQQALLDHGFDVGKDGADGGFGDDTLKAVKDAQTAFKLPVNGVVDQSLLDAIGIAPPAPARPRLTPNPVVQAIGAFVLNVVLNQALKGTGITMDFAKIAKAIAGGLSGAGIGGGAAAYTYLSLPPAAADVLPHWVPLAVPIANMAIGFVVGFSVVYFAPANKPA